MKSCSHWSKLTFLAFPCLFASLPTVRAEVIAAWETTGQANWGTQGLTPAVSNSNLTIGGLARGAGVITAGGAADNAWGGKGWNAETIDDAVSAGRFFTFTVTPRQGFDVSVASFAINYRRSPDGPPVAALQFQVGSDPFIDVEDLDLADDSNAGAPITGINLNSITELQHVAAETITFRIVPYAAQGAAGSFYVYGPLAGADLTLQGTIGGSGAGDTSPPLVNGLTPADNASNVATAEAEILTVVFNEGIARGTGMILVKEVSTGNTVNTLNIANPSHVLLAGNQIGLMMATPLVPGTAYYVEIPQGAIIDQSPGANAFAGFSGTAAWNFTLAATAALPTVVVNKYFNGTPDRVELLVVGSGTAGSTADLRGMMLKDFTIDMTGDGGGKLLFAANPLWAAVPAGTLITLSDTGSSPDLAGGDFTLGVGLNDGSYFSSAPGSGEFDIEATDLVLIKAAGSEPTGTEGGIHALAAGPAAALSYFTLFPGAKVRATVTAGTNLGVRANNATGTLADFVSGTDATGGLALGLADFGVPNSGANAAYIASLRGLAAGDGDGLATVTNSTLASPFLGLPMLDDGQTGQSVKVTLLAQAGGVTLANARITVPAVLGTPGGAVLSGPGAAGATVSLSGQIVTVSGTGVTTANALEVTISGLSTPVPTLAHDSGNYPLQIATSAAGGTLTPLSGSPAVRVIVPIASLRDVDGTGIAMDSGAQVAVEGIATEADFGGGAANFSAFIQDTTAGINLFSTSLNLGLVRGNLYAVTGTVAQVNGQTQIIPASSAQIIDLGAVPEHQPQFVTLAVLFANPEAYEGKLIAVSNLTLDSGTWEAGALVTLKDPALQGIDLRIQPGSTATAAPSFPANIAGIFGQSDAASPFTAGYQLMPRDPDDLALGNVIDDYVIWAANLGEIGDRTDDPDFDGLDNASEYAFGLSPVSGSSANPYASPLARNTGKFTYTRRKAELTALDYKVFTSTTLGALDWTEDTLAAEEVVTTVADVETVEVTLSAPAPLTAPKLFIRVVAE